jgi:hypothetical protein
MKQEARSAFGGWEGGGCGRAAGQESQSALCTYYYCGILGTHGRRLDVRDYPSVLFP